MNSQLSQMSQGVKIPPMPDAKGILKQLRIDTGLEEPEKQQANPFATEVPQVEQLRSKPAASEMWDPMVSKATVDQRGTREEDALTDDFESNEQFMKLTPEMDALLTRISDEIVNPESMYDERMGQEDLAIEMQQLMSGLNLEGEV
jgi:hypothetical protein